MSPRTGRPRKHKDPVNFTINVDRELLRRARKGAERKGVGLAEVVRAALSRLAGGRSPQHRSKTSQAGFKRKYGQRGVIKPGFE